MQTNYTPGPWAARVVDTINASPAYWHITDQHRGVVGDVQSVNPADARLIAAAPDLLAALQALEWAATGVEYMEDEYAEQIAAARRAIARATGD